MVDILERLQSQRTSLGTLWPEPNLHEEAAEKIIQLRKELDETKRAADAFVENEHLREEITRLREENALLREALKPFANELKEQKVEVPHVTEDERFIYSYTLRVKHLRAAAAAIREGGGKDD